MSTVIDDQEGHNPALLYSLNNFEQRVLSLNPEASDASTKGHTSLMTDADTPNLHAHQGVGTSLTVRYVLGTATRRKANGHGQYRRIFDRS